MLEKHQLISQLEALGGSAASDAGAADIDILIDSSRLPDAAILLLEHEFHLSFLTAVHVSPACRVVYQFGHFASPLRVLLRTAPGTDGSVPSIARIYQGADWHEREVHDFFGITFAGHPNLKPLILTREERNFKPLLKSADRLKDVADIYPPPAPPKTD